MKKKTLAIALLILSVWGCDNRPKQDNGPSQDDYDKLKHELDECKKIVAELSDTPQNRLMTARKHLSIGNIDTATAEFQELIRKYPGTMEAKAAEDEVTRISAQLRQRQELELRKKTLGYKALSEHNRIRVGPVEMKFSNVSLSREWSFDEHESDYHLIKAERGSMLVTARLVITADTKDPELPPIAVYKMVNGELKLLGKMGYRFVRWNDYGSYLGNYADYGNDFAHSKSIPFSCGLEISEDDISDNAVFVVVAKQNCILRSNDRFGTPPVSYVEGGCNVKQTLSIDDLDGDYSLTKIFNRNKL